MFDYKHEDVLYNIHKNRRFILMIKILLDPGHGGRDPGAVYQGLKEKDLTLAIAMKLKRLLEKDFQNLQVKLTREKDETLSLLERTKLANRWHADLLVSIHINAGKGKGFESFIYHGQYPHKTNTMRLRNMIHTSIIDTTGFRDRGKKEANFHILRESSMAAILTENGFIDHEQDARLLSQDTFLDRIARGHVEGLAKALDLGRITVDPNNRQYYMIRHGDTLWQIAKQQKTSVQHLIHLNPDIDIRRLQIGQLIRLK